MRKLAVGSDIFAEYDLQRLIAIRFFPLNVGERVRQHARLRPAWCPACRRTRTCRADSRPGPTGPCDEMVSATRSTAAPGSQTGRNPTLGSIQGTGFQKVRLARRVSGSDFLGHRFPCVGFVPCAQLRLKKTRLNRSAASTRSAAGASNSPLVTSSLPSSVSTHVTATEPARGSRARST